MSRLNFTLHPYQQKAANHILDNASAALFMDMGLGKTLTTLYAIDLLLASCDTRRVLIVAPKRVQLHTWPTEIRKWGFDFRVSVITGTPSERKIAARKDADVYLINYENLVWLIKDVGRAWSYDMVVFDESSKMKDSSTKRFRAYRQVMPKVQRTLLLTGTPASNGLLNLWSQVYMLDAGQRLCRTMTTYKQTYFESDYMGYNWTLRPGAEQTIHDKVQDICLSMEAEDYLDMPELITNQVTVYMDQANKDQYKQLENDMFVQLQENEVEAVNAAVLTGKCLQFSNGAVYTTDDNGEATGQWEQVHDAKLEALQEIQEGTGGPILVFYNFKSDLQRLKAYFKKAEVLDKEGKLLDKWNKGEIEMLLAHPACLHANTEVLTENRGWVRIVDVKTDEKVFDGIEFVSHKGCSYAGVKPVINLFGITLTQNHKILVDGCWEEAKYVKNTESVRRKARYSYQGDDSYLSKMLPLWSDKEDAFAECKETQPEEIRILQSVHKAYVSYDDRDTFLQRVARYSLSLFRQAGQELWRKGNRSMRTMGRKFRKFLPRYVSVIQRGFADRPYQCEQGLFQRKLSVGYSAGSAIEQTKQSDIDVPRKKNAFSRVMQGDRFEQGEDNAILDCLQNNRGCGSSGSELNLSEKQKVAPVYDLVDCGRRHRFVIRNKIGELFISHNSAGHGLNMQAGGNTIVWFGLTWSLENYMQANARLHRQGQEKPVIVHHIITDSTVDQLVLERITTKRATQDILMDALKDRDYEPMQN